MKLIPIQIETRGEVIASNAAEFRQLVREALANINREPSSDEEFGQAELDTKALKAAEDSVTAAKAKAIADAEQLNALFSTLDDTAEEIRAARLELEKQIKTRKAEVKDALVIDAMAELTCSDRLRPSFRPAMLEALKGKRTLASMAKSLDVTVKVTNGTIAKSREILDQFGRTHGTDLIPDSEELEIKRPDQVEAELRRRWEAKKAADEKARLQAEAAKAKAEAAAARQELEKPAKPDPLNPHDLPAPPKVGAIPVGNPNQAPPLQLAAEISESEEWSQFRAAVFAAFSPLKDARAALTHAANTERATILADAINAGWKSANAQEVPA